MTDAEIIKIRQETRAKTTTPWSDTFAFARAILAVNEPKRCSLGVGCDEYGMCYADNHNSPEQCGRR